jgi:membrane-bound serine protease (ClpP class)
MKQHIRFFLTLLLLMPILLLAQNDTVLIYKFDIKEDIGPASWRQTMKSIDKAEQLQADYILIHMNTYGGLVYSADSIRTKILNCKIPVYVFIDNNAASAGALISIACDSIYMRSSGSIGAATVVSGSGEQMPDKYQSYMRSTMRATAESHGSDTIIQGNDTIIKWQRDPRIAEAMVDPTIKIEGIIDSGKVLTFTASEAMRFGFCDGTAESCDDVLKLAGIGNYVLKEHKVSTFEKFIGFLINPMLQGLLIMLIIGGIYFELQTPGIGFPLGAAIIAALIYFAPLYIEGFAEHWEIILFVIGIVLIGLEVFVIPGFGIAGISGIILVIIGLTLSLIDNIVFEFESAFLIPLFKALFIVVFSMLIAFIGSIWLTSRLLKTTSPFSFIALHATEKIEDGFISVSTEQKSLIGKTGIAATVLRPSGKIEIDNNLYEAMAINSFINKGEEIEVIRFSSYQLYVRKISE